MRIFAALPLPAQAVDKLQSLAAELKKRYPDLKVVKPHGLHITMVFFGELNQDQVLEVLRRMDNPELKVASVQAALGGVGQFPPKGQTAGHLLSGTERHTGNQPPLQAFLSARDRGWRD